jgi:hypothetical protein
VRQAGRTHERPSSSSSPPGRLPGAISGERSNSPAL